MCNKRKKENMQLGEATKEKSHSKLKPKSVIKDKISVDNISIIETKSVILWPFRVISC